MTKSNGWRSLPSMERHQRSGSAPETFPLCELRGHTYREAAALLGCSKNAMQYRLTTARRRLGALLSGEEREDERISYRIGQGNFLTREQERGETMDYTADEVATMYWGAYLHTAILDEAAQTGREATLAYRLARGQLPGSLVPSTRTMPKKISATPRRQMGAYPAVLIASVLVDVISKVLS